LEQALEQATKPAAGTVLWQPSKLSLELSATFISSGEYLMQLPTLSLLTSAEYAPQQEWYSFANT
jgi:hypothetical protein